MGLGAGLSYAVLWLHAPLVVSCYVVSFVFVSCESFVEAFLHVEIAVCLGTVGCLGPPVHVVQLLSWW